MSTARKAIVEIKYESKNITRYIAPYLKSFTYKDYEHGQSDEIEIQLEDKDGLWQGDWYPQKGDTLSARIGYEGENLLNCGSFEIDEINFTYPSDTLVISGLATNIKKPVRQKNTAAYENKTLVDIAREIGKKHDFKVVGSQGFIKVGRVTQRQETDLAFLKRIAETYGYIFKIADKKLVFFKVDTLHAKSEILTLNKGDLTSASLTDKTSETYSACTVTYFDSKTKKTHTHTEKNPKVKKGDTLKITERCESKSQAILKAKAALARKNGNEVEGTITFEGNTKAIAGVNTNLTGFRKLSGKYHITESEHTIYREGGYNCTCQVKKVG